MEKQGGQSAGDAGFAKAVRHLTGMQVTINGKFSSLVVLAAALGAVGYGYMRWKKSFYVKRDVEKAASELTKQHAPETIDQAEKHLSERIQSVEDKMLKQSQLSQSMKESVSGVQETITGLHKDMDFLRQTVDTLVERLSSLSEQQDIANHVLADYINFLQGRNGNLPEGSQGIEDSAEDI